MNCIICKKEGVFGLFPFAVYRSDFDHDDLIFNREYLPVCQTCQVVNHIRKDVDNELGLG